MLTAFGERKPFGSGATGLLLLAAIALSGGRASAEDDPSRPSSAARERYESFLRAARLYEMRLNNDDEKKLNIVDKPVLRWGNQARDNGDRALLICTYGV